MEEECKFKTYLLESLQRPGKFAIAKFGTVWQFPGSCTTYTSKQIEERFIVVREI